MTQHQRLLIIDFGSQVTQLIARRLRELNVFCEIRPYQAVTDAELRADPPQAVILSGGPDSVTREGSPRAPQALFNLGLPVFGICYGQQVMMQQLGGRVEAGHHAEYGRAFVTPAPGHAGDGIFAGLTPPDEVAIRAQLMAQPAPELADRTLAALSDSTPLVTRARVGQGQVVLFHVTANAEWSNLPISGLFVQMLDRLVETARVSPAEQAADDRAQHQAGQHEDHDRHLRRVDDLLVDDDLVDGNRVGQRAADAHPLRGDPQLGIEQADAEVE